MYIRPFFITLVYMQEGISLIITTYDRPKALALVLRSVLQQTEMPAEIIVAEDGQLPENRAVVASFESKFIYPLRHVHHVDQGFRLSAIRNKAITEANFSYLIMIDGDMMLHPKYIEDHNRARQKNRCVLGSRVFMDAEWTAQYEQKQIISIPSPFNAHIKNSFNAIRSNVLSSIFSESNAKWIRGKGCSMAFYKEDALAVNGFNEAIKAWGFEDSDFFIRMQNKGVELYKLKFNALAYHLYHPIRKNEAALVKGRAILEKTIQEGNYYTRDGISSTGS